MTDGFPCPVYESTAFARLVSDTVLSLTLWNSSNLSLSAGPYFTPPPKMKGQRGEINHQMLSLLHFILF